MIPESRIKEIERNYDDYRSSIELLLAERKELIAEIERLKKPKKPKQCLCCLMTPCRHAVIHEVAK